MKEDVSSCSGETSTIKRNFKSFFARSNACAYPFSKNGSSWLPYSSSNSRIKRAAVSLGFSGRRPLVFLLCACDGFPAVIRVQKRGRNGKMYPKKRKYLDSNEYATLKGVNIIARSNGVWLVT